MYVYVYVCTYKSITLNCMGSCKCTCCLYQEKAVTRYRMLNETQYDSTSTVSIHLCWLYVFIRQEIHFHCVANMLHVLIEAYTIMYVLQTDCKLDQFVNVPPVHNYTNWSSSFAEQTARGLNGMKAGQKIYRSIQARYYIRLTSENKTNPSADQILKAIHTGIGWVSLVTWIKAHWPHTYEMLSRPLVLHVNLADQLIIQLNVLQTGQRFEIWL